MFTRFGPASQRVLRSAEQACRNHNHYYIGAAHLLLALLEEHDAAIERRLAEDGMSSSAILGCLRRAIGTGDERLWEGILVTPRISNIVRAAELAVPESREIAPDDLYVALLVDGGLAAELVRSLAAAPATR